MASQLLAVGRGLRMLQRQLGFPRLEGLPIPAFSVAAYPPRFAF